MTLLRMTLVCGFIDQQHDCVDRIHLMAAAHGFYIILAVEVQLMYLIHQQIRRNIILIQHNGITLRFEEAAFNSWSPRLLAAGRGIRMLGFSAPEVHRWHWLRHGKSPRLPWRKYPLVPP